VASGIVPIAGANDGGGSIRIPAAYCGLFGLKPTRGRTPVGPNYGRSWQGASAEHVLTRSVRDSAAMLDLLHGHEKAGAYHAPLFEGSYLNAANTPIERKLRIAFSVKSPIGTEVHPECRDAVLKTASILESMGHRVEEMDTPVDGHKIAKSYLTMYFGETAALLASLEEVLGRKVTSSDVEPTTWLLGLLGKATSAEEFVLSIREWDKAALQMETFHETYDYYMTPTTAFPPARIGELQPTASEKFLISTVGKMGLGGLLKKAGIVDQIAQKNLSRTPFTQLANLTGQPAMSMPLHLTSDGLPSGVQVMAARGREDLLLQLAGEIERSEHWVDVRKNPLF
jgi:amidase